MLATLALLVQMTSLIKVWAFHTTLNVFIFYALVFGLIIEIVKYNKYFNRTLGDIITPVTIFLGFILIYALWCIKTNSYEPLNVHYYLKPWITACFTPAIVLAFSLQTRKKVRNALIAVVIAGVINFFFQMNFYREYAGVPLDQIRFGAEIGGYSQMGQSGTLGLALIVFLWFVLQRNFKGGIVASSILISMFIGGIIFSGTRSSVFATFLGLVYILRKNSLSGRMHIRNWIIISIIILVSIFAIQNSIFKERLKVSYIEEHEGRFSLYSRIVFHDFPNNFLFGVGPFQWGVLHTSQINGKRQYSRDNAENVILQVLAETGFFGFILFIWVIFCIWKSVSMSQKKGLKELSSFPKYSELIKAMLFFTLLRMQFYGHMIAWGELLMVLTTGYAIGKVEKTSMKEDLRINESKNEI